MLMLQLSYDILLQSYERRSKAVRGQKEQRYWGAVTVEIMSDGECEGEKWILHCPLYQSNVFNRFIDKLDDMQQITIGLAFHVILDPQRREMYLQLLVSGCCTMMLRTTKTHLVSLV